MRQSITYSILSIFLTTTDRCGECIDCVHQCAASRRISSRKSGRDKSSTLVRGWYFPRDKARLQYKRVINLYLSLSLSLLLSVAKIKNEARVLSRGCASLARAMTIKKGSTRGRFMSTTICQCDTRNPLPDGMVTVKSDCKIGSRSATSIDLYCYSAYVVIIKTEGRARFSTRFSSQCDFY